MPPHAPQHIASLDGLRGFAALAVFFAHANSEGFITLSHTSGLGKIGVALFYALSGFLMAHLYLQRPWTRSEIRNYLVARFARILPLFYLAVLFGAVLFYLSGLSVYGFRTPAQIALNLGFLRGNGVLWSIPVEVQFYLIFILLWAAAARGWLVAAAGAFVVLQGGFLLLYGGSEGGSNALVYWIHYFVVGIAVSRFYSAQHAGVARLAAYPATAGIAFGLLLICLALMPAVRLEFGWGPLPIFVDPFVLVAVVLFMLLALLGRGPFRLFATPVMGWLGARSFGIYLFHVPVLLILAIILPPDWMSDGRGFCVALAASVLTADLLHRLVERPAGRMLRRRLMRPQLTADRPLRPELVE